MADKADKHPYVPAPGGLAKTISHCRKSLPSVIDSGTLRKFGFAPNNESYILNVFRFLKFIDAGGKKTDLAAKIFSIHEDEAFAKEFSSAVRDAYSGLFDMYGDGAWTISKESLITYFRQSDQTSATVGTRQTSTFQVLARFSGHGESRGGQSQKPRAKETPSRPSRRKNQKEPRNPETPATASESTPVPMPAIRRRITESRVDGSDRDQPAGGQRPGHLRQDLQEHPGESPE